MPKSASSGLIAILGNLGGAQTVYVAELVTITLSTGDVLRYCTGTTDLIVGGNNFSVSGPLPIIGDISWNLGVEVDELKLQLLARDTDLIDSKKVLAAVIQGLFDNALVLVERVYMPTYGDVSAGSVILFQGNVSDIPVADAGHAEFDIKSRKELLNIPMPYLTYQPGCRWPLYGAGCGLAASTFLVAGTLSPGSGKQLLNTSLGNPDQYFDQGYITFTSGANAGLTRAVRQYVNTGGQILLFIPLPNPVATGDGFNAFPGCDKQLSTCTNKFGNTANFGGMPFTPIPETAV